MSPVVSPRRNEASNSHASKANGDSQTCKNDEEDVVITFGDFTVEEAAQLMAQATQTCEEDSEHPSSSTSKAPPSSPPTQKSWADAVGKKQTVMSPLRMPTPTRDRSVKLPFEEAIQQALMALDVSATSKEMKKRGLVNQGNTCFQNAIMQSVLACAPFLNLLVDISSSVAANDELLKSPANFKAWRHMIAFTREFEEPTLAQLQKRQAQQDMGKTPKPIRISGFFMDVLSAFQKSRGEQEDALEFLEFFLDYLHSEYEQSGLQLPSICEQQTRPGYSLTMAAAQQAPVDCGDEWSEVGKGGKSSVVRQPPVCMTRSPINWLFKGTLRSELKQSKQPSSITIEPFHCLHLNLEQEEGFYATSYAKAAASSSSSSRPPRIEDMIKKALSIEVIEGADASRRMKRYTSMESLPVVLTLHIKRFTYHPEQGPVKLTQAVKYPASLAFPTHLMSPICKAELGPSLVAPTYELFAVVSHHGKFVVGGHYTCVCRDNKDQWFHFDDEHVTSITEAAALKEEAYLLFYIRSFTTK